MFIVEIKIIILINHLIIYLVFERAKVLQEADQKKVSFYLWRFICVEQRLR